MLGALEEGLADISFSTSTEILVIIGDHAPRFDLSQTFAVFGVS
jgi:hypothetical protein